MKRAAPKRDERWQFPEDERLVCLVSTYHEDVTGAMLVSALETLAEAGVPSESVQVVRAPGTFELPILAYHAASQFDVAAVLCFGLVLKGETEHDRYIATACATGLMEVGLKTEKPVLFGVLTCSTLEQAQRRARRESEGGLDKGREVARAALDTLAALAEIEEA